MSLLHKLYHIFFTKDSIQDENDLWDNLYSTNIDKLDKTSIYPISPYQAFKIAEQSNNLKSDYFRNASKYISYLDFSDCKVELVDGDNGKKYWFVKITEGEFSSISTSEDDFSTTFVDGTLGKDDFKLLQCLIDVNTGDYIYYPKK